MYKHTIEFIYGLVNGNPPGKAIYMYIALVKDVCLADLLECLQHAFLRYRLSHFVMEYL